mmetsp:Transcript_17499/g.35561  ORF Transcript_17499/g.35561 Transcript_17499/m.35561 type:complete len:691 (-) Transcript_17499:219-2291(-)
MRASSCSPAYFGLALLVLLLIPAGFLVWSVWFVVRQIKVHRVITFEPFDRAGRKEAGTSLRSSLRRKKGQSLCAWVAGLSLAWADFTQAAWTMGEWKGNPRFLGMFGALFQEYDDTHFCYLTFELVKKLVLAFFLVAPPSWGNVQLYGASSLQTAATLAMVLRRPHTTYSSNFKSSVVQGSQAFTAVAFLLGSLKVVSLPLADIAGIVMWSQIAAVAYIVLNQVGDIIKVIVSAFFTVGRAVKRGSAVVKGAVESMRLARGLRVANGAQIARVIKSLMGQLATFELEAEKLLALAERSLRPAVEEHLKASLEAAGAKLLLKPLDAALKAVAEEVDTQLARFKTLKAAKSAKKDKRMSGKATARVAPEAEAAQAQGARSRVGEKYATRSPPPSPPPSPSSPPLLGVETEAATAPPPPQRLKTSGSSAGELVRKLSRGTSLSKINGYDRDETPWNAPGVTAVEMEAAAAAKAGEELPPPAEAAHTAAQVELVTEELAAQLQLPAAMRELLNAPHAEAAEKMVEARWLEAAGWRDRAELEQRAGTQLAERARGAGAEGGAAGATHDGLLAGLLPPYAAMEAQAVKKTMVEVHEEDKEYKGGTTFVGSRAELREALTRITLQKVQDAVKEAACTELERSIGAAAEAAQHVVGKALMSKLQPRVQKLSDAKTAGMLQYSVATYLRLAEAAVPPRS